MAEFGHVAIAGEGFHADGWGTGNYVITAEDGKTYRFEDSDMFGPALVDDRGDILKKQPGERSLFWRAHRIWKRQGRRTQEDGSTCIWDEPKPMVVRRIVGRHHMVVEGGEEDGKTVFLDETEKR